MNLKTYYKLETINLLALKEFIYSDYFCYIIFLLILQSFFPNCKIYKLSIFYLLAQLI